MADDFLHAHALGYGRVEDAGTAFADEIDRVARQFVVLHFEQQQRVRLAGRVEAFCGFQRVAEFEWALRRRHDHEIRHITGHVHHVAGRRAVDDDEFVIRHGFAQSFQFADIGGVHGERQGFAGVFGVARPCGGVALRIGVQHGHVAVVPCGRGGQRHGGGGFAAAAFEVDDRDDHEGSSASTINLYKTYILFIYWIDDSHADGVTALAM